MNFVFLYKLKGKRVVFLVMNILHKFSFFPFGMAQCIVWYSVLCGTVYCMAQ